MGAGRPKKPTKLHVLNGNPSKLDLEKRLKEEPQPGKFDLENLPDPPEWLDEEARAEWQRIVPELVTIGLFTKADVKALEAYCKTYSRWKELERQIDQLGTTFFKTPNGHLQALPQITNAHKYLNQCKSFMTEFGLTPSARGRMTLPSESDEDEMEKMFRKA